MKANDQKITTLTASYECKCGKCGAVLKGEVKKADVQFALTHQCNVCGEFNDVDIRKMLKKLTGAIL